MYEKGVRERERKGKSSKDKRKIIKTVIYVEASQRQIDSLLLLLRLLLPLQILIFFKCILVMYIIA